MKEAKRERLFTTRDTSLKLIELGIDKQACFYWRKDEDFDQVYLLLNQAPEPTDVPAWSYEEIRIMIGNHFTGADLPEPRPRPIDNEDITFFVYFPDKQKSYSSGAEASAEILIYLITTGKVTPTEANRRYSESFKPE